MEVKFKGRLERGKPGAVRILNRIVTVTENGLEYEADQRHAEIFMKDMGNDEGSRGLTTPGSNSEGGQDVGGEVKEKDIKGICPRKKLKSNGKGNRGGEPEEKT